MSTRSLTEAILDGAIRSTNFFNGRLLSAEDLSAEQNANHTAQQRLGQAIGHGVVYGLQVGEAAGVSTLASPVVTIEPGLALNRRGQTLNLSNSVDVSLVSPAAPGAVTPTVFNTCQPPQTTAYVAFDGMYLLVLAPADGTEGKAPVSGLGNVSASCNTRYTVEGLQFRLIQLDVGTIDPTHTNSLRNAIAYLCFGSTDIQTDPFGAPLGGYGLLDSLSTAIFTDWDVPLAVIHWTAHDGIVFVDQWSVRRRVAMFGSGNRLASILSARRAAEAEAMLLQFQDQVEDLRSTSSNPEAIVAADFFRYLPPVGILPLTGGVYGGFRDFFKGRPTRGPFIIEGTRLEPLIRTALAYPPIDLHTGEMVWLYQVRQNLDPQGGAGSQHPYYLLFSSGHIPPFGEARFDVARWDYGNYKSL